jgi:hypothetical protein
MNLRRARSDDPGGVSAAGGRRRLWIAFAAVVVVVGLAVVAVLLWHPFSRTPTTAAPAGTATASGPAFDQAQADALTRRLGDPNPAVAADALADSVRPAFLASPSPPIPAGDTLTIDTRSFMSGADPDHGTVRATAAGPQSGAFLVMLVREHGTWHVLGTVPL